jgi:SpoVK/Ycf46/Vps4 family AAA+-type ATPase
LKTTLLKSDSLTNIHSTYFLSHFVIPCVGLDTQIQEIKESVELPLTHPEYYEEMGIKPPKGVILYGPPGTGKTLLAKAVANQTSATFLRVVGSELIQKYLVSTHSIRISSIHGVPLCDS